MRFLFIGGFSFFSAWLWAFSRGENGLGFSWFFVLGLAAFVGGLWGELESCGAVAECTWWETERSEFFHNFGICVVQLTCPVEQIVGVEVHWLGRWMCEAVSRLNPGFWGRNVLK